MMISNNPVGNRGKLPAKDVTVKSTDSVEEKQEGVERQQNIKSILNDNGVVLLTHSSAQVTKPRCIKIIENKFVVG